jgi:hypothetical protein
MMVTIKDKSQNRRAILSFLNKRLASRLSSSFGCPCHATLSITCNYGRSPIVVCFGMHDFEEKLKEMLRIP